MSLFHFCTQLIVTVILGRSSPSPRGAPAAPHRRSRRKTSPPSPPTSSTCCSVSRLHFLEPGESTERRRCRFPSWSAAVRSISANERHPGESLLYASPTFCCKIKHKQLCRTMASKWHIRWGGSEFESTLGSLFFLFMFGFDFGQKIR